MKLAFMSFSTPQLTLSEMLALASNVGYEGLEPRAGSGHAHGIELEASKDQRTHLKEIAARSQIDLCCLAVSCRYADPATVATNISETLAYIDLAVDLEIPRLRVFGGQIPDGIDRPTAIENVSTALREVAKKAESCNVTVCLETHDDWCDPKHVAAVMTAVGSPAVAVNWDIMHPVRRCGYTIQDSFQIVKPWIRHVHVHDGSASMDKLEMAPIGTGNIDHRSALSLLKSNGYDGYLSGEWINWEPYEEHLPRELSALRQIVEQV